MTTETTERICPADEPYSPEARELLEAMMPPNSPMEPLGVFKLFVRNIPTARVVNVIGQHMLGRALSVERRHREIVILRVCARCDCEYEWGVHVAFWAERVGLSEEQVESTTITGRSGRELDIEGALLVRLVDELHDGASVGDALWQELARIWSDEQLIDLLLLTGWYHAICYLINGARLPNETWGASFPRAANKT